MILAVVLVALMVAMLTFAATNASGAIPGPNKLYVGDPKMTVNTEGVVEIIDGSTFDFTHIWGTVEKGRQEGRVRVDGVKGTARPDNDPHFRRGRPLLRYILPDKRLRQAP